MHHIVIFLGTRIFHRALAFKALLLYYWNAAFCQCIQSLQLACPWVRKEGLYIKLPNRFS